MFYSFLRPILMTISKIFYSTQYKLTAFTFVDKLSVEEVDKERDLT